MVQAIESGQYGPGVFLDAADSFERGDTIPEILTRMRTSTSAAPGYGAPCTPTQDGVQARHDGSPVLSPRSPPLHTPLASPPSGGRPDPGQQPDTDEGMQMLGFADHKEASFYSTCMAASLKATIRTPYESDPEYLLAAEMAKRAIRGIVRCIQYYKTALVRPTACAPLRPGGTTEFTMIASLGALYAGLVSQFCTEQQRRVLRAALQNICDEGGIGQVSALLKRCTIVPRDDIERDRDRMRARRG
ncbi:hypothetical protein RB600_010197 [Gaeumannomyces tritici]